MNNNKINSSSKKITSPLVSNNTKTNPSNFKLNIAKISSNIKSRNNNSSKGYIQTDISYSKNKIFSTIQQDKDIKKLTAFKDKFKKIFPLKILNNYNNNINISLNTGNKASSTFSIFPDQTQSFKEFTFKTIEVDPCKGQKIGSDLINNQLNNK